MTHAGIDGYSRMIVYLSCSAKHRADTVYKLLLQAARRYSLPSRVRSDQGGENRLVALHMIRHRGAEGRSMIVGSSVHNQRVERLWCDLYQSTIRLYYRLFYYLEARGCLDPVNALHLYSVFKPRINNSLLQFQDGWNHHGIRTVNSESPYQIFTAGALQLRHSGLAGLDFFTDVDDSYGAEEVGHTPQDVGEYCKGCDVGEYCKGCDVGEYCKDCNVLEYCKDCDVGEYCKDCNIGGYYKDCNVGEYRKDCNVVST